MSTCRSLGHRGQWNSPSAHMSAWHTSPELLGHGDGVGPALVRSERSQCSALCCFRCILRKAELNLNLVTAT